MIQIGFWMCYFRPASAVFFFRYGLVAFSSGESGRLFLILFSMFCVTIDGWRVGLASNFQSLQNKYQT